MKSAVLFIATSLILVAALVPISIPNPVQATEKRQWCWVDADFQNICSDTKAACQASIPRNAVVQEPCYVTIVNVQWCWVDKASTYHCFDTQRACLADQPASKLVGDLFLTACHKVSR